MASLPVGRKKSHRCFPWSRRNRPGWGVGAVFAERCVRWRLRNFSRWCIQARWRSAVPEMTFVDNPQVHQSQSCETINRNQSETDHDY